ncbi:MAG: hypothetical protein HKN53_09770, partial [Maribacter sp.]|nr:hypothetical protein [Maribacter sp.]
MPTKLLKRLLLILFFSTTPIFPQEGFVTGQLIDKKNGEPIVFATIRVKGKAIGVISNLDGSFRIPERFKDFGSVLEISSMGYVTKDILLYDLSKYKTNSIRLVPAVVLLDEVVVEGVQKVRKRAPGDKTLSAIKIVDKAINSIPLNYPTLPFTTVGYYRDFQRSNNKYINLNEALFEVWDQGFSASDYETTKIRILENKRNLDFPIDSVSARPYDYISKSKTIPGAYLDSYGGNEFTILRIHDALRNNSMDSFDYVNVLKTDFLKNHTFKKEDEVLLNNEKLYKISFKKYMGLVQVKGNLFISQQNFAIYKMEYTINNRYREKLRYSRRYYKNRPKVSLFSVVVGYAPVDGFMYPNFHSMKNTFRVQEPPKFIVEQVQYSWGKKNFIISFNNHINEKDALKKSNYKVYYNGKKLNIHKIVHIEDQVLLYPKPKIANTVFKEIYEAQKNCKKGAEVLNIKIEDLRDINGN